MTTNILALPNIKNENINFRYFGYISEADSGVVTAATKLDREAGKAFVGISFTPPEMKFDKAFSRAVARYRLAAYLAPAPEAFREAQDVFQLELLECQSRVRKVFEQKRISMEEYEKRRAVHDELRKQNPVTEFANIGYYDCVIEYFTINDFALNPIFVFEVDIASDATHGEIDIAIIDKMQECNSYAPWVYALLAEITDTEEGDDTEAEEDDSESNSEDNPEDSGYEDGEEEDEAYEAVVESCNESLANITLVNQRGAYFLYPTTELQGEDEVEVALATTPICDSREELIEKLEGWLNIVRTSPALETVQYEVVADEDESFDECDEPSDEE